MDGDERLFDVLDDLEAHAEALYAAERDAELADRSRAEYAQVPLAARLMASTMRQVTLHVAGVGTVAGRLRRVGSGWCLVGADGRDWLVPLSAIEVAEGLSERALPEVAWSPLSRLALGSALRRLADEATPCVLHTRSGRRLEAVPRRVGQDFVEVLTGEPPRSLVVALAGLGAVSSRGAG